MFVKNYKFKLLLVPLLLSGLFALKRYEKATQQPIVIMLNGCSSTGKSTVAKAILRCADIPFLHWGIDKFILALDPKFICGAGTGEESQQTFWVEVDDQDEDGNPIASWHEGPFGEKLFTGRMAVARTMIDQGFNLILDEVLWTDRDARLYAEALKGCRIYFINITCDKKVMLEREKERGDRTVGLANGQLQSLFPALDDDKAKYYDMVIDTTGHLPITYAKKILAFIEANPEPQGFLRMQQDLLASQPGE